MTCYQSMLYFCTCFVCLYGQIDVDFSGKKMSQVETMKNISPNLNSEALPQAAGNAELGPP